MILLGRIIKEHLLGFSMKVIILITLTITLVFMMLNEPQEKRRFVTRELNSIDEKTNVTEPDGIFMLEKDYQEQCLPGIISRYDNSTSDRLIIEIDLKDNEISIYESRCVNGCSNNGACHHGKCKCHPGYFGEACQNYDICHKVECNMRGICDPSTGSCACDYGFVGSKCEYLTCNNNGVYDINADVCVCDHGYTGLFCESCARHPPGNPEKEYICCDTNGRGEDYIIVAVPISKVNKYLGGHVTEFGCVKPNNTRKNEHRLDCGCRTVHFDQEKREVTSQKGDLVYSKVLSSMRENARNPVAIGSLLEGESVIVAKAAQCLCDDFSETGTVVAIVIISIVGISAVSGIVWFCWSINKTPGLTEGKKSKSLPNIPDLGAQLVEQITKTKRKKVSSNV
jgi:hypothetical protein